MTSADLHWAHTLAGHWLLPALVGVPLGVALVLLLVRSIPDDVATRVATGAAGVTLVLAVLGALAATPFRSGAVGLSVSWSWIPALGVRFHLGMDGVSTPLVLLTALLAVLVTGHLVRVRPEGRNVRPLAACYLAVSGGALATFTALDAIVFFLAFEIVLLPMWFVIAGWGDDHQPATAHSAGGEATRREAANRFILYTALGSAVMLLGLLLVAVRAGTTDLTVLARAGGAGLSGPVQTTAAVLIVLGLAVKAPAFPLHTWLAPAHTTAPTGGSVLLAGVLLKMGTYGLIRLAVPIVPEGTRNIAPVLGALGVAGILWGGLVCFVERDLKRLIAFSSVAHMGFVLLGIASMTPRGLQGALFANVAHGLITGLLFLTVGGVKDRHHTADLASIGPGMRDRLPRLGWLLAFGAIAGLGLPGLAGFWGELLSIIGAWGAPALGPISRVLSVGAVIGTVVAAAYLLRVLRAVWHGPRPVPYLALPDAGGAELAVATPLVLLTILLGLLPWILMDVTGPAVRVLLAVGGAR